jgi:hypothetical protein
MMENQKQAWSCIKRLYTVFFALAIFIIILCYISPSIREHRMQAIYIAVGAGMLVKGVDVYRTRRLSSSFQNRSNVQPLVEYEGRSAQVLGLIFFLLGIGLIAWSSLFWLEYLSHLANQFWDWSSLKELLRMPIFLALAVSFGYGLFLLTQAFSIRVFGKRYNFVIGKRNIHSVVDLCSIGVSSFVIMLAIVLAGMCLGLLVYFQLL